MPELPEVETIKNDLSKKILNKKIVQLNILLPRIIKNDIHEFRKNILLRSFKGIKRIGKLIVIKLEKKDSYLLIHLKMTGQLVYNHKSEIISGGHSQDSPINNLPNKYTRVDFKFSDGSRLFFNDMRTFGYLKVVNKNELNKIATKYGEDPINDIFDFNLFYDKIKNRQTSIKAILLNQAIIAGIGNIYADEILFNAGVRPQKKASLLKKKELEKIFKAIKPVLKKAIKYRGTTFNDYVDASGNKGNFIKQLKVYGREGQKCHQCGAKIKKIKVVQRGTHYCQNCQE
ncbi:MAG: bifunctional DNA-formamidopyrimidine glycosylase/DNA-(apurinic or apyrimidinic site) lyase [Patescibacteria group bacterium]|nr:bifunctional DNA-formamidopyrimidine glycosylase/DNA-(apurinic or apyrimidinic site) lyase [Patescibacteria group bacterium]